MTQSERLRCIQERLTIKLLPLQLDISDDSHLHVGHAGAPDKPLIERHRMIYDLLQDMMHTEIHALSIQARSPDELQAS